MRESINPILGNIHQQVLKNLNSKKKDDLDPLELKLKLRLKELELQIKLSNDQLKDLERKVVGLREGLQRICGSYEGYVDLLKAHYAEQKAD